MSINSLMEVAPPRDGRQSDAALRIARGTRRLLRSMGIASLTELPLASGRRADIVGVCRKSRITIIEVKSSVADFRADCKWIDYRDHCDALYFAVDANMPVEILPADAGLIIADEYGAHILRVAPEHKLAPATRKEVLVRFALGAADRLHLLYDPDGWSFDE
jgi:hypothetical protein